MAFAVKLAVFILLISCFLYVANCDEERKREEKVVFKYKANVTLECSKGQDIEFYQVNEKQEEVKLNGTEKNVQIVDNKLILTDLRGEQLKADYFCKKDGKIARKFTKLISPFIYKPEKTSQTVSEGSRVEFKCTLLFGDEKNIKWVWKKNNTEIVEEENRIKIVSSTNETTLSLSKVVENDRGEYECQLTNEFGDHSEKINLRVKDAFAALWPFLGIVGEVLILCVILLIFEKKCSKKRNTAEEDNEQTHTLMGKETNAADTKKRIVKA